MNLVWDMTVLASGAAANEAGAAGWNSGGWLYQLVMGTNPKFQVAHAALILAMVIASGLALGSIKVFKIGLGAAGVLFTGIAFAHYGMGINHTILEFVRDFGLILFVYTIGLQVGPGFLGSLRKAGLPLNLMAASIVLLGVATTLGVYWGSGRILGKDRQISVPVAVGLLSGAVTNTPSLAAANQAIVEVHEDAARRASATTAPAATSQPEGIAATEPAKIVDAAKVADAGKEQKKAAEEALKQPAMAYAMAYPFGIMGIIMTMLVIRAAFKVNVAKEQEEFNKAQGAGKNLKTINLEVTNPNLDGKTIGELPMLTEGGVVISRVLQGSVATVATPDTRLRLRDIMHAVGAPQQLERLKVLVGTESKIDVKTMSSDITTRKVVVTRRGVIGKTLDELDFEERFEVVVTRVGRAEVEITATPGWRLQFGDVLLAVGKVESIAKFRTEVGDSVKMLDHPHFIPVFVGITLGVILGSVPFPIPGVPAPVRLGLAGGPLLVAIILARIGQIGPLSWYLPRSSNMALREFGITLFLACVGLACGGKFVETLTQGDGVYWMAYASLITFVPICLVGLVARLVFKMNFMNVCGLVSGSMTDPPALAFANQMAGGESPSIAYATVYPLTMLLRVVTAQTIVLVLYHL